MNRPPVSEAQIQRYEAEAIRYRGLAEGHTDPTMKRVLTEWADHCQRLADQARGVQPPQTGDQQAQS